MTDAAESLEALLAWVDGHETSGEARTLDEAIALLSPLDAGSSVRPLPDRQHTVTALRDVADLEEARTSGRRDGLITDFRDAADVLSRGDTVS